MKKIIAILLMAGAVSTAYAKTDATVYKDANCGCCAHWITYMQKAGYSLKVVDSPDMASIKSKYHVPANLQSCHTTIMANGQIIEGHVPVEAVKKLAKNPQIKGIAVPGMKGNSPGMGQMDGDLITLTFDGKEFSKN